MTNLSEYMQDGANHQARAVLCFMQDWTIEDSWDVKNHWYKAVVKVGRWENCREQGYVLSLRCNRKQLNIAFFEHRNSDRIHAVKWEQITTNTPNIDVMECEYIYKDKYDTSFSVGYGEIEQMAYWIWNEFENFWKKN